MDLISPGVSGAGRWVVVLESAQRRSRPAYLQARRFERSQRRRRRILVVLVIAAVGSGLAAGLGTQDLVEVHLGVDSALAFYVGFLLESKRRRRTRPNVYSIGKARRRHAEDDLDQPLRVAGGRG
jgi:hypothetical protein